VQHSHADSVDIQTWRLLSTPNYVSEIAESGPITAPPALGQSPYDTHPWIQHVSLDRTMLTCQCVPCHYYSVPWVYTIIPSKCIYPSTSAKLITCAVESQNAMLPMINHQVCAHLVLSSISVVIDPPTHLRCPHHLCAYSGFLNLLTIGGGPSVSGYGSLGLPFGRDSGCLYCC
jgi:hypothetical protein